MSELTISQYVSDKRIQEMIEHETDTSRKGTALVTVEGESFDDLKNQIERQYPNSLSATMKAVHPGGKHIALVEVA